MLFLLLILLASDQPITLDVSPKVAVINSYTLQTFHVRFRIPQFIENIHWSVAYTCGNEIKSSFGSISDREPETRDRYVQTRVTGPCHFEACVYRLTNDQPVKFCTRQEVTVSDE